MTNDEHIIDGDIPCNVAIIERKTGERLYYGITDTSCIPFLLSTLTETQSLLIKRCLDFKEKEN